MITSFSGRYRFLSNFWIAPIPYCGREADTVEHHYQAAKAIAHFNRDWIYESKTPGEAKRRGKSIGILADWDQRKKKIMFDLVWIKFLKYPELLEKLQNTGDQILVEGNTWGDDYWGSTDVAEKGPGYTGHNYLGKILMSVRDLTRIDTE